MTRFGYVMTTYFLVLMIGGLSFIHITPALIWNASASTPVGLYIIQSAHPLEVTDLVAVNPPEPLATFLDERGYLGRGAPLMKRVAALPGQQVCRHERSITVDGVVMGEALARDRVGRDLPVWQGCRKIAVGEVFLMNPQVHDSLDGRYFGPISASSIIGHAIPLWTDEGGDGRYEWRASTR